MKVIFNGILKEACDPDLKVSPFGAAIEFGQSVFETFKVTDGRPPATIKQHWERLFQSAQALQFPLPPTVTQKTLDKSLAQLINTLELRVSYRCKILVNADFWWMKMTPLLAVPPEVYSHGVRVDDTVEVRVLPEVKAVSPLYPLYAAQHSASTAFETLYFSPEDFLLEGSVSNVIAVLDGVLVTPSKDVLPGIEVREVLKKAQLLGLKTSFSAITREQLKTATEIFLTNSIKGLVPVNSWKDWQRKSTDVYDQLK